MTDTAVCPCCGRTVHVCYLRTAYGQGPMITTANVAELSACLPEHVNRQMLIGTRAPKPMCVHCQSDVNDVTRDRMRKAIQQLKLTTDPTEERNLTLEIKALGHPDIEGLTRVIADSRGSASGGRKTSQRGW